MNYETFWQIIRTKEPVNLLFICAGNICRSPYAEMEFEQLLHNSSVPNQNRFNIQSGGFIDQKNVVIHHFTKQALLEEGVSEERVNKFHSRTMRKNKDVIESADIIIVMDKSNRDVQLPLKYREKAILLSEAASNEEKDIDDPALIYDYAEYLKTMQKIKEYLTIIIKKLESN
jgi:protein-tyrosine phosphatase